MLSNNQPYSQVGAGTSTTHTTQEIIQDVKTDFEISIFGGDLLESEPQESTLEKVSGASIKELSLAVLHEAKNKLMILEGLIATIPEQHDPEENTALHRAKSLCQQIFGETIQFLILYKAEESGKINLNLSDLHSTEDFLIELVETAKSLSNQKFKISAIMSADVPLEWCFDRTHLSLAVMNAVHNCLRYAKKEIIFSMGIEHEMLKISVIDDSGGYPAHILNTHVGNVKGLLSSSGLGLRFANFIASSHSKGEKSGFVRIKNDGDRAVFEILIP